MELNEATKILNDAGFLTESLPRLKRGRGVRWSGYTFRRPTANASYVKIMKVISELGNAATKREIFNALGWEYSHGNRSGIFTALADEGLLAYDPATKTWSVTEEGDRYIERAIDAFDNTQTTCSEAVQFLQDAGFICEDTETNDDEIEDLNNEWRDKYINRASDKELDDIFWKRNKVEKRHLDLEDKIAAAKEYNERNAPNKWEGMSTKEKIAALIKLMTKDGLTYHDENPLNPDSSDIFGDFYDIPELADVWDKATEKLEDIYLSDEDHWSSGWDDWLFDYGDDILVDILNGKTVKQIVKEYESALD